jgi:hypothetical protein
MVIKLLTPWPDVHLTVHITVSKIILASMFVLHYMPTMFLQQVNFQSVFKHQVTLLLRVLDTSERTAGKIRDYKIMFIWCSCWSVGNIKQLFIGAKETCTRITSTRKNRLPKESPTRQNWKCCRHSLIGPVHGRYWKMQVTVHARYHRRQQNLTFKHENGETLNLETSADVFIWRLSWNLQCDTLVPYYE